VIVNFKASCIDVSKNYNLMSVAGSYNTSSVGIHIEKCVENPFYKCKSESEINQFLRTHNILNYILNQKLNFEVLEGKPVFDFAQQMLNFVIDPN
jgi:hypothetical protein